MEIREVVGTGANANIDEVTYLRIDEFCVAGESFGQILKFANSEIRQLVDSSIRKFFNSAILFPTNRSLGALAQRSPRPYHPGRGYVGEITKERLIAL